jgi:Zn-dependent protease with chaperone function
MSVSADYLDGQRAQVHRVALEVKEGILYVLGETVTRQIPLQELHVSEPMGAAPRLIKFPDGAHCEVRDHAALNAMLREHGHTDSWVVNMQARWAWALVAVLFTLAIVGAGYRWGLPAVSEQIAYRLPENVLSRLGEVTLNVLDDQLLSASKLKPDRQQALRARFENLANEDTHNVRHHILFRDGQSLGANAFALPDGNIVITDQLIALAGNDEEIMGVLAHELGHLKYRHSLRMLIQGSVVGFVLAWYIGDVSSVAAGLPALLLQARYSRDHEREADRYAATVLKANGIPPQRLADMLMRLEASHASKNTDKKGRADDGVMGYLASHPATRERIEALKH